MDRFRQTHTVRHTANLVREMHKRAIRTHAIRMGGQWGDLGDVAPVVGMGHNIGMFGVSAVMEQE